MISYKHFHDAWKFIQSKLYTTDRCQRHDGIRGKDKANWYIVGKKNANPTNLKSFNNPTKTDII